MKRLIYLLSSGLFLSAYWGIFTPAYADANSPTTVTLTPSVGMTPTAGPFSQGSANVTGTPTPIPITPGPGMSPTAGPVSQGPDRGAEAFPGHQRGSGWGSAAGADTKVPPFGTGVPAPFRMPYGVAVDARGNIDVVDTLNSRIRQIDPDGGVTTLAGSYGRDGVDGEGSVATFDYPTGIATDASGNVYIADSGDDMIRKMNRANQVTSLGGQAGVTGYANGRGTDVLFNNPWGVAVDSSGIVYVADTANNMIRKVTPKGEVTTLAGGTTPGSADGSGAAASFNHPMGVAVDSSGIVYVADTANNMIRKITPKGEVTTLAGGWKDAAANGLGSAASFNWPTGIAVDASGNIFVADSGNSMIREITPVGQVSIYAGPKISGTDLGPVNATAKFLPYGVAVDSSGNVYGADPFNGLVRKIQPN